MANSSVDPVCAFHGKRWSEHECLVCVLCFEDITVLTCYQDENGIKWDICKPCRARELEVMEERGIDGLEG